MLARIAKTTTVKVPATAPLFDQKALEEEVDRASDVFVEALLVGAVSAVV